MWAILSLSDVLFTCSILVTPSVTTDHLLSPSNHGVVQNRFTGSLACGDEITNRQGNWKITNTFHSIIQNTSPGVPPSLWSIITSKSSYFSHMEIILTTIFLHRQSYYLRQSWSKMSLLESSQIWADLHSYTRKTDTYRQNNGPCIWSSVSFS